MVVDDAPIAYINVDSLGTVYNKKVGDPPLGIWGALSPMDDTYLKQ
jgi:peptide/nickel transport system substrate-binding protein